MKCWSFLVTKPCVFTEEKKTTCGNVKRRGDVCMSCLTEPCNILQFTCQLSEDSVDKED